jgi:hypothetical protein
MSSEDTGIHESGITGPVEAEGAPPSPVRLLSDPNEGGSGQAAESMPVDSNSTGGVPDVCDAPRGGAFDFLSPPSAEWQRYMCVEEIKAFVRGDREGLACLVRVLPNILKTYPACVPEDALRECGLEPMPTYPESQYPTFYFRPALEKPWMIKPFSVKKPQTQDERENYRSQELMSAYEALRSEWSS